MKLEQAIRWRGERGFDILAASPGITPSHAKMLEMFSDMMRPLFARQGDSVLTLAKKDNAHVLSLCTLRFDQGGRGAIFTHGAFFSSRAYKENPEDVLQTLFVTPPSWETRYDPEQKNLPVLDTGTGFGLSRAIFSPGKPEEGMGLESPDKRSRFLWLAAKVLGGSGALTIEAGDLSKQERINRIQIYALYLAESLPKRLLWNLTFSSGADYRQKLSLTGQGEGIGAPAPLYRFPEEETKEEREDPLLALLFLTLASLEGKAKREVVDRMDCWLEHLGAAGIRLDLLACAFYLSDTKGLPVLDVWILDAVIGRLLRYQGQGRINQEFLQGEIDKARAIRGGTP